MDSSPVNFDEIMADSLKNMFEQYNWTTDGKIFVTGFTWLDADYVSGKAFLNLVSQQAKTFEDFKNLAGRLNGQFAVVILANAEKWAVCSHTWSYPLFYRKAENTVFISDNPQKLLNEKSQLQSSDLVKNYFLLFGVAPDNFTLIEDIYQILPGELVRFRMGRKESFNLFPYPQKPGETEIKNEALYALLTKVFQKYSGYLKDKQVLLPLTGGYDSRVLGCLLKESGHRNVICATWGRDRNSEVKTAEKVAEKLGYKHIFVDYSKEVPKDYPSAKEFTPYIDYSAHFSSMPFLQDYFAIKTLKEGKIIDNHTVVLPGHPGDLLRGSHLDSRLLAKNENYAVSKIISAFGTSYPLNLREKKQLENYMQETFFSSPARPTWMQYDVWDYQERQCKFIGNSTLAFSFFGMEVLMPLFDLELLTFFRNVPLAQKLGSPLYNQTLESFFFERHNVDFDLKPPQTDGRKHYPLKNIILKNAPHFLKKRRYPMHDPIFYKEITEMLRASGKTFTFKNPFKPNNYNSYIIQWYLQFAAQKIAAKK